MKEGDTPSSSNTASSWESYYLQAKWKAFSHRIAPEILSQYRKLSAIGQKKQIGWLQDCLPEKMVKSNVFVITAAERCELQDICAARAAFDTHDYQEVLQYVRTHVKDSRAWAQNNLGVLYEVGLAVERNPVESLQWYAKAAEQGNVTAQENLAILWQEGEGVPGVDEVEAWKWFSRAAATKFAMGDRDATILFGATLDWTFDPMFRSKGRTARIHKVS